VNISLGKGLFGAALLLAANGAIAAPPLEYDCDVPPDKYSQVSQASSGPEHMIAGTITVSEMRQGRFVPVAGARLDTPDKKQGTGFQLIADNPSTKVFNIVLNMKNGADTEKVTVGQIDAKDAIPFRFTLSGAGKVTLSIGSQSFDKAFVPLQSAKAMAFCSTGQFKFTQLTLSSDS
jgi:hypothetical protein